MSNALAIQFDQEEKMKYDTIARQGPPKEKVIYNKYTDLVPKEVMNADDPDLQRPNEETIKEITEKTRVALRKTGSRKEVSRKAMPVHAADKLAPAQYICYMPSHQGGAFNSRAKQRVIQIVEMQKDPMEPPRFKISKKIPQGSITFSSCTCNALSSSEEDCKRTAGMKDPATDIQVEELVRTLEEPTRVVYTMPLYKRLAAEGRGLQTVHINEFFFPNWLKCYALLNGSSGRASPRREKDGSKRKGETRNETSRNGPESQRKESWDQNLCGKREGRGP